MLSPGLASGMVFLSLVLGEGEARGPLGGFPLLPAHGIWPGFREQRRSPSEIHLRKKQIPALALCS